MATEEGYDHCTKSINEPCRFHPVDCDNCRNGDVCQMRADVKAHPDKIKRCRFYRPKKRLDVLG